MSATDRDRLVREAARAGDPDRYLSALFAPAARRPHLAALYAFNAELSRIPERVREPGLGLIRLQWWRDALTPGVGPTGNPIADALCEAVAEKAFFAPKLIDLIDVREADLAGDATPDRDALADYLVRTEGAVFALAAGCLGDATGDIDAASGASGLAYGLTGQLRAAVTPEKGVALAEGDRDELIEKVREQLTQARILISRLPKAMRPAFLPLALVEGDLNAIAHQTGAPMPGRLARLWRLTAAAATGRT